MTITTRGATPDVDDGGIFSSERYSEMTHLRGIVAPPAGPVRALRRPAPTAPTIKARWDEPVITATGPHTYRVVVPIAMPIPDELAVLDLTAAIQQRWIDADRGPAGLRVAAVRGFVETPAPDRVQLTLLVATTGGANEYTDRAYLGRLANSEMRRTSRLGSAARRPGQAGRTPR